MSAAAPPVIETRRRQMFPTLEPVEIERMRRFGEVRTYRAGEALARAGEKAPGLTIILSGKLEITRRDEAGRSVLIVSHGPGEFTGELAQLAGRPTLVDAVATEPLEGLIIPPDRLRALLIAEAELGERIMRAVMQFSQRLVVLVSGAKIADGLPEAVIRDPQVERAYLGQ